MKRRGRLLIGACAGLLLAASSYIPFEDLTEADWVYSLATRTTVIDGREVHYPTPTAELAAALALRSESAALRHLAEARFSLGDRAGAVAAMEKWAAAEGPEAWGMAARWAAERLELAFAFRAAETALPGLPPQERRSLADARISWGDAHPEAGDPLTMRKLRAELFPDDGAALEDWLRALEQAGRLAEVEAALVNAKALSAERRLLLRSDLAADHRDHRRAFDILDAVVDQAWSSDVRHAYAQRVERGNPTAPERWRAALERAFDGPSLVRLAAYMQGQGRGEAAADLLRQVELRHGTKLDRGGWLLLSRLHAEIDAVPEAFRARLAAAQLGGRSERAQDLAELTRLALRAGGRPLPWGAYNDAAYRLVARVDRTPGFWTGGVSFLLTGQDWNEALARLESDALPVRTFATARALAAELERVAPSAAELPGLRALIMARHVERGEGREALALLPALEAGPADVADEARRVALLAARQTPVPTSEELRLFRARLRSLAPDGARPELGRGDEGYYPYHDPNTPPANAWSRISSAVKPETYAGVFGEAILRLEQVDPTHRSSLDLCLSEMDRMPEAEALWLDLADRLGSWNLDDDLGPRFERALERFKGATWWPRLARWYARRSRQAELRRLAEELALRFRGAAIFERSDPGDIRLPVAEQPPALGRVRLVQWGDWVRFKALQRFPHSPRVFAEARGRLLQRSIWETPADSASAARARNLRVVVDDGLLDTRRAALLFIDSDVREEFMAGAMRAGRLEALLTELEGRTVRTPVDDRFLFDGWCRLSQFERAVPAAQRLAAAYPGDEPLARSVLSLHRSLSGLDPKQAAAGRAVVERTAPSLLDPDALWTELGELEEERGRPEAAKAEWRRILARDPRNAERTNAVATLLWDYGHMADALRTIEEARLRLGRPQLLAFEAGVLREEQHDINGAIREYLAAVQPEGGDCFCSWFERDQRSLRRLAQLVGRQRVLKGTTTLIESLRPGVRKDEQTLAALFPLATIVTPDPGLDWDADDWIDGLDHPNDPVGREQSQLALEQARGAQHRGLETVGNVLLERTYALLAQATASEFIDAAEEFAGPLIAARWSNDRVVSFNATALARRAALAPSEEERIVKEVERARFLFEHGRGAEADAVWAALVSRVNGLPEGAPRMRAEVERASFIERSRGAQEAAKAWQELGTRYPWSLGIIEERAAFLRRHAQAAEARQLIEAALPRAAAGHRESLFERLTGEALAEGDLPQARRAVEGLMAVADLDPARRIGALKLLARLRFKEDASFEALPLATAAAAKLGGEWHAALYAAAAGAAMDENVPAQAVTLWIEALNRSLDRGYLADACRAASKSGQGAVLLDFFERQRARSPRDVRWAVATREIKRYLGDVDGAIAMAKAAVSVRPEREGLWREAADLMVRADRVLEAADYLEGWNRTRPADENVVRWRGELYSRLGQADRVLTLESAALAAYRRQQREDGSEDEWSARQARAARRLMDYGFPGQAWRLLAGSTGAQAVSESELSSSEQVELALMTGHFRALMQRRGDDAHQLDAAAAVARTRGRSEHWEEIEQWLMGRLFTPGAPDGSDAALGTLWRFVEEAGLESQLRRAIARRYVATRPGPWQTGAPAHFIADVATQVVARKPGGVGFERPALGPLWVRALVRRDRTDELYDFLAPRWQDLIAQVRGAAPLPARVERLGWASWLDSRDVCETWARVAAGKPEMVSALGEILSERRKWDRFWALAARSWDVAPLLAVVPAESRTAWFRFWEKAERDPVLLARRESRERVALAVGRLLAGTAEAAKDPLIVKLRGPRTVGAVLGKDVTWVWPEFSPRRDSGGRVMETGDDRIIGQGRDTGRIPGVLWGERPGEAWYVLETLARWRERDGEAPFVALELPERGRESERTLLAARLAQALGDSKLALELAETMPIAASDTMRLALQLRLLVATEQRGRAGEVFRSHIRRHQAALAEAQWRALGGLGADLGLGSPRDALDPAQPLAPAFLAYLHDKEPALAGRFATGDPAGFRSALAARWSAKARQLSQEQLRFYLKELWAQGAAQLPRPALRRLGTLWLHAAQWLDERPVVERAAALAALEALPDPAALDELLKRTPADEAARLLRVRLLLHRNEDVQALALFDAALSELVQGKGLALERVNRRVAVVDGEEGEGETDIEAEQEPSLEVDGVATRLAAWLAPFREARRAGPVEERIWKLLAARRDAGPVPVPSWRLALVVAPDAAAKSALHAELERAWLRGDWVPEGLAPLVEALASVAPKETPRWLTRWPLSMAYDDVSRRARVLVTLKEQGAVADLLASAAPRASWTAQEELQAFDTWRRVVPIATRAGAPVPGAPQGWISALPFWREKADGILPALAAHLRRHPYDVRAARAALRSVAPGEEEPLRLAEAALDSPVMSDRGERDSDGLFLRVRAARGMTGSWRAAAAIVQGVELQSLDRDLTLRRMRQADIDQTLFELGRVLGQARDAQGIDGAIALLTERGAAQAAELRAERERLLRSEAALHQFQVVDGRPVPYRPRDLTWALLAGVLNAEGIP
jgi:predicted Zn-dependent protease